MRDLFSFPNPVNEKAARTVAAGVVLMSAVGLATGWMWLLAVMCAGFWLRLASGPRFSPLGLLATKVVAPRLGEPRLVPGPPKRFAQGIGALTTLIGVNFALGYGIEPVGYAVFGIMALFASLEAAFGFCVGCRIFAWLMRIGIIPEQVCEACADISLHRT